MLKGTLVQSGLYQSALGPGNALAELCRIAQGYSVVPCYSLSPGFTDADAEKEVEGVVQGAAALLRAQSLFRAVSRQPSALAGLVAALMAASQHSNPQAQPAIMECFVLFALRFLRPPQMATAQVSSTGVGPAVSCFLCAVFCVLSAASSDGRSSGEIRRGGPRLLPVVCCCHASPCAAVTFCHVLLTLLPCAVVAAHLVLSLLLTFVLLLLFTLCCCHCSPCAAATVDIMLLLLLALPCYLPDRSSVSTAGLSPSLQACMACTSLLPLIAAWL